MSPQIYVFDLDGTLYRGSQPLPHAVEVVSEIRNRGIPVRFLTNNSGVHPSRLLEKLVSMGFEASLDEVYTTSMGAGIWMQERGISSAFVVGEPDLPAVLSEYGIQYEDKNPQAVVVGICRSISYELIDQAMQHIGHGAQFIATNRDTTYPIENGVFQPGGGAIVAAIATCSEVEPHVIGKPETYLLEKICEKAGVSVQDAIVVGDRLDTDIEMGKRANCHTFLVLTGSTTAPPAGQAFGNDLRSLIEG